MKRAIAPAVCLVVFSIALGHFAWQAYLGPAPGFCTYVGEREPAPALVGADPKARQLYLRRELYLTQQPRHAWIQVLSRDQVEVFCNGKLVQRARLDGYPVAILAELTSVLKPGLNVVAIHARQSHVDLAPAVAVSGAYVLSDGEHPFGNDADWRCATVQQRRASWWFMPEFDDRGWPLAPVQNVTLRAPVKMPPAALVTADFGSWITPLRLDQGRATLRKDFVLGGRPRSAWLRITTSNAYRLALNGSLLDQQEEQLGVQAFSRPVRRLYDVTTLVSAGKNVLSLAIMDEVRQPHVRIDAEFVDDSGQTVQLRSDKEWLSAPRRTARVAACRSRRRRFLAAVRDGDRRSRYAAVDDPNSTDGSSPPQTYRSMALDFGSGLDRRVRPSDVWDVSMGVSPLSPILVRASDAGPRAADARDRRGRSRHG